MPAPNSERHEDRRQGHLIDFEQSIHERAAEAGHGDILQIFVLKTGLNALTSGE